MYLATSAVFLAECIKIVSCLVILYAQSKNNLMHTLKQHVINAPRELARLAIPSALYAIQNNLLYIALSNMEAASFQVVYQLKILSTAVFFVILLGRSISRLKWLALFLLMVGVTLVQLQTAVKPTSAAEAAQAMANAAIHKDPSAHGHIVEAARLALEQAGKKPENPLLGFTAVILACISSGFAGCYFEKVLKTSQTSMWVRNLQLGLSGGLFSLIAMLLYDGDKIWNGQSASDGTLHGGVFQGYTILTVLVVSNQAMGGLLVAMVVKYADNILKGFATSLSIILSGVISFLVFDFVPSMQFALGASVVVGATFLYGLPDKVENEYHSIHADKGS